MIQIKMEPITKIWYENLKAGKLTGLRCKNCGKIMFPPVPVCGECGKHDMEWVEVSGEGELVGYSFSPEGVAPYMYDPMMIGLLKLKEGCNFQSWILDVGPEDEPWLFENLPVKVKAEIIQIDKEHDIYYPVYRVVDKDQKKEKDAQKVKKTGMDEELYEKVMETVAEIAEVSRESITEETHMVKELDYSSLRRAMLVAELEELTGVSIPQGRVKRWETVGDLIAYLNETLA